MISLHDLELLIDSGKRLIVFETHQEVHALKSLREIAKHSRKFYYSWSATQGLEQIPVDFDPQPLSKKVEYLFGKIKDVEKASVFVLIDFHPFIDDALNIRRIKDVLLEQDNAAIILLSPKIDLPEELTQWTTFYETPLPTRDEVKKTVYRHARAWKDKTGSNVRRSSKELLNRLIDNLMGLPMPDTDRLARQAIFNDGIINKQDLLDIAKEKFALLNQDSLLNLHLDQESIDDVAGLSGLKQWLNLRGPVFSGQVSLPGEDIPKGLLLLGVQGCGKSLAAKAVAGSWHVPLLHLDIGSLYNRFFGQTEENLRDALKTAEMMAPCVLWLDEIEKGLSAVSASDDVSRRMLGTFLTWMAEKKHRVFVVATANDVSALPPELLRKGRFDEVFFVDLPDEEARAAILAIHLKKRKIPLKQIDIDQLVEATCGFSGAELEQVVVSATYASYGDDKKMTTQLLQHQVENTRPLSILMEEQVQGLRDWATHRTVPA